MRWPSRVLIALGTLVTSSLLVGSPRSEWIDRYIGEYAGHSFDGSQPCQVRVERSQTTIVRRDYLVFTIFRGMEMMSYMVSDRQFEVALTESIHQQVLVERARGRVHHSHDYLAMFLNKDGSLRNVRIGHSEARGLDITAAQTITCSDLSRVPPNDLDFR